jgi:hypothetical protein
MRTSDLSQEREGLIAVLLVRAVLEWLQPSGEDGVENRENLTGDVLGYGPEWDDEYCGMAVPFLPLDIGRSTVI